MDRERRRSQWLVWIFGCSLAVVLVLLVLDLVLHGPVWFLFHYLFGAKSFG